MRFLFKNQVSKRVFSVFLITLALLSCKKEDDSSNKGNNTNQNPNQNLYTPEVYLIGPNQGKKGEEYEFFIYKTRYDHRYLIDWGDGSEPFETFHSLYYIPTSVKHTWNKTGEFKIRIKETNNKTFDESEWKEIITINICDDCFTFLYKSAYNTTGIDMYPIPESQRPIGGKVILANFSSGIGVFKINVSAELIFSKFISQPGKNENVQSSIAFENNIVILSKSSIYKIDYEANILFYRELENVTAEHIIHLKDGNFLICGYTPDSDGEEIAFVAKLNDYFEPTWIKDVGKGRAFSILEEKDGSIIVWLSNLRMAKLDKNGNTLWLKDYFNGQVENKKRGYLLKANDGNYIASAIITSNNGLTNNLNIFKITPEGNLIFSKSLIGVNYLNARIFPTKDNCFIICGNVYPGCISYQKINSNIDLIWSKVYNLENYSLYGSANALIATSDNKLLLTGSIRKRVDYTFESSDFLFLMKTDEYGNAPILFKEK